MPIETTHTKAHASFATLCDKVCEDLEVVIIHRPNAQDVALIAADELASLMKTVDLYAYPAMQNAS